MTKMNIEERKKQYKLVKVTTRSRSKVCEINSNGVAKIAKPLTEWVNGVGDEFYYAIYRKDGDKWEEYIDFEDDLEDAVKESEEILKNGEKVYVEFY